jgi:hypothetical protein
MNKYIFFLRRIGSAVFHLKINYRRSVFLCKRRKICYLFCNEPTVLLVHNVQKCMENKHILKGFNLI